MLDGGSHAIALDTVYHRCRYPARQVGIFGIILEVTSAERASVDIQRGGQEYVATVFFHLVAHALPTFLTNAVFHVEASKVATGNAVQ